MSTVFLGTSDFAAVVLRRLAGAGAHHPALVITRPDRPRGRGRQPAAPPVADAARELGIELMQPLDPNEAVAAVTALRPQAVCVCAYGAIIREPLLSAAPILNVHPSLLPRWRGAAPIERAMIAGDPRTGISIMRVGAGLDNGPVCLQESIPIEPHDSYGSLAPRLQELGAALLLRALEQPDLAFSEQDESRVTYAEKIEARDRILGPELAAPVLERLVRALHPHIGARTPAGLRVLEARLQDGGAAPPPGKLGVVEGRLLYGPQLELLRVQPPGGRAMSAADFMRGHAL